MPLPLIVIVASAIAGAGGAASAAVGAKKMYDAKTEMERLDKRHKTNQRRFRDLDKLTTATMDELGNLELEVCESFDQFADLIEQIKNRPEFDNISMSTFDIPHYNEQELRDVSVAASLVVGAIGGVGTGAAGGVAAAIAAKGAIAAVCVASTGTPIATLHGIAATNAILAVLGGGTLAAGGGGIALGATVLSAATAGIGILVGGIVFNLVGSSLSTQVDEAKKQVLAAEKQIDPICEYLGKLRLLARRYIKCLQKVYDIYLEHMDRFSRIALDEGRTNWYDFTDEEKLSLENLVLLVGVLYGMCKTPLVVDSKNKVGLNEVNLNETQKRMDSAEELIRGRSL